MEFKKFISICCFAFCFVFSTNAFSADLYFDSNAAGGGDGSPTTPYNAFSDYTFNLNSVVDGDMIYIAGDLGVLDLSGVTNDPIVTIKPRGSRKATIQGLIPHGTPANIIFNIFRIPPITGRIMIIE